MPDKGIKPPNKRLAELTTEITLSLHEKFKDEKDFKKRDTEMIDYLVSQLANYKASFEDYEKIINELS